MDFLARSARAVSLAALLCSAGQGCGLGSAPYGQEAKQRSTAAAVAVTAAGSDQDLEAPRAVPAPAAPEGLVCLAEVSGGAASFEEGTWWLVTEGGRRLLYDDEKSKTEDERIERPDLQDTLQTPYRFSVPVAQETRQNDAGRVRHLGLLRALYGRSEDEVRARLTAVDFLGTRVWVHDEVAEPLRRVAVVLEEAARTNPELAKYLRNLGGGFSWRTIAGTDRLSAHSFGIAIDLNPRLGAYYRWRSDWSGNYPQEIVSAFEREGFIWGGRWTHYDAMHFEFRPELFVAGCRKALAAGVQKSRDAATNPNAEQATRDP